MKQNLYKLTEMVRIELESRPDTREDDRLLLYSIYRDFYGVTDNTKWVNVVLNHTLPKFESVRRCRQKLMEEDESLRPSKEMQQMRFDNQEPYIQYALGEERWI